jgi:hypothetical protein
MAGYTKDGEKNDSFIKKAKRMISEAVYNTGYEHYYNRKPPKSMTFEEKKRKVDARDREQSGY